MQAREFQELRMSFDYSGGPGPFVTHRVHRLPNGRHLVATSRRHRKGLPPHEVATLPEATALQPTRPSAFGTIWAPRRLGWWVAVFFAIGSTAFLTGALAATWPATMPAALRDSQVQSWIFFVGSTFFTSAAWFQWLEVINRDVVTAFGESRRRWRWFGWCPRNLGYLASLVQLAGTILFNFSTADAILPGFSWRDQDLLIWLPNMLGSICFLVASYLAYVEVAHGFLSFAPHSISWWVAAVNILGSVAFQISAFDSVVGPVPSTQGMLFWSTFFTAAGSLCFLIGAFLLIPELFDTVRLGPEPTTATSSLRRFTDM